MATSASSNLARLVYIPETEYGVTPTVGQGQVLRFTSESLELNKETTVSEEIRADRLESDLIQTDSNTSGDINGELSYGTYDPFFAAVLGSAWVGNTLTSGVTVPTFTVEKQFLDVEQFLVFTGEAVSTMTLEMALDSAITVAFGFMGADAASAAESQIPGVPVEQSTTRIMDTASGFATLVLDGEVAECAVQSLTLTIDGNLRARRALGKLGACEILPGTLAITGDLEVYFQDATLWNKYANNEDVTLVWTLQDTEGNSYNFNLPRVRLASGTPMAGGKDQDVVMSSSFRILADASNNAITITRTPAP